MIDSIQFKRVIVLQMAQRKVIIKYFPKNFNHDIIVKRGRGKDKLMMVRNMLPMSLRCNTCANYLYIGTKFNMRMEICNEETYLGIKVFRFYFKCTYCYAQVTFKTDPKNHDYVVQAGGTRNYQAIKDAQQAEKYLKKLKVNEKQGDSMKYLENKSYDSKRQMELMEALEDIKNLNKRQAVIDPEDLLKNMIYAEVQEDKLGEQDQAEMEKRYEEMREQMIAEKLGNFDKKQCIQEENQEINSEEHIEKIEEIKQQLKVEEIKQQLKVEEIKQQLKVEEKKKVQVKSDWKKMLNSKKGEEGKGKGMLSNMKKKIVKVIPHKDARQVNQEQS